MLPLTLTFQHDLVLRMGSARPVSDELKPTNYLADREETQDFRSDGTNGQHIPLAHIPDVLKQS
jgi:hypothetical protein